MHRFDPIHTIDADMRIGLMAKMRDQEQRRAQLFMVLNSERYRRRVHEWSIKALKIRRLALIQVAMKYVM